MTAINPKPEWVTDQTLDPLAEYPHYTLSDDLTTASPRTDAKPTDDVKATTAGRSK